MDPHGGHCCLLPAMASSEGFTAVAYNILAPSLGCNAIPWVMTLSSTTTALLPKPLDDLRATLKSEYKSHFHKNHHAGSITEMRRLWSVRKVVVNAALPGAFLCATFVIKKPLTPWSPQVSGA